MNLSVTVEKRFNCTPDGAVWTEDLFAYPFWCRYLEVFGHVHVIARARRVPSVDPGWQRVDGERVSLRSVPYYLGPYEYITKAARVRRAVRAAIAPRDAIILRAPGMIATVAFKYLAANEHPFGIEVVGDPYDVFAPGTIKHPLRPFFRWWYSRQQMRQCAQARAVAYVTERALQLRYPAAPKAFVTNYSSVELPKRAFVPLPRPITEISTAVTLVNVGMFNFPYKGHDVLVDAVAMCVRQGFNLRLNFIGDGRYRPQVETNVRTQKLENRVRFLGQLPAGDAVRAQLDQAELFVLPSRTEGLPRAMIEAMARGLPCIGSSVGGIPELLPPEDMVPPGNPAALARKIREVVTSSERMARMSARNLEKATKYREENLHERRNTFYGYIKEETEAWLKLRP